MSQHIRRASLFLTLIFAITAFAETETALIIQPYSGSKKQHALSQIGHVKISADSLLVYSPANKVLGCNALADIRYIKYDDYVENPNGQCGDSLWWEYLPETHTLVFRGSGAMYDLTQSAPWALAGLRDSIWNIQFSDSMTTIANQAFIHCRELTEVTIPNSVTEIHSQAFEQCERLRKVTLPNTLMQLGASTFNNCYRLSDVNIPSSLTEIASGAFYNCDSLSDIRLPNTITRIDESAFRHIESLVSITLPSSVTTLEDYVFADCWNLVSINLSNNITYIGGRVFENCGSLQTVVLPDSLEQILTETFRNCTGLTTVTFPEREVRIGSGLFNSCTSLTDVHLGEGTTSMEAYAFANCTSLRSMVLPSTMSSIEMSSFEYCTGLDTLTSLAKVPPYLGENAFLEVDSMIPVYVPARSVRSYHNHDWWSYFRNFIGLPCDTTFYANDTAGICEGETYTWHERVLTATGTYIDTLQTLDGCDSICTLDLTVHPTYLFEDTISICAGTAYTWHGRDLYQTGIYYDSLLTINGCDSIWTLTLTVNPAYNMTEEATICQGETYTWHDAAYTEAGRYTDTLHTVNGCDSICNLVLTVNPTFDQAAEVTICEGTTYSWHGKTYTTAGIYYDSLQTINGCDSIWTLTLTVNPAYNMTEEATICQGETYTWHDAAYTEAGRYTDTLHTVNGCDSICNLVLTVNPTFDQATEVTICEGTMYSWHGKTYTTAGIYYDSLQTINGCDSIWTLTLTINRAYNVTEATTICQGETYTWHDVAYTEAGRYIDTLHTVNGCDSICNLVLTVNPTFDQTAEATICEGTTYSWHGKTYTTAGIYYDSLQTINGCDSIWTLTLTVNPAYDITEEATICQGTSYRWQGSDYTTAGTYHDSLQTIHGCDSILTLVLTVNETYSSTEDVAICQGEAFEWHGQTYTTAGRYQMTLEAKNGCDSVCTLNLTVNPSYYIEEIVSIREDKLPYQWQGQSITQAGTYYAYYRTVNTDCDSIYTLQLMVTALPIYTVNVEADHGHVNGTGTYPEGTRITLTAVPDEGFEFQMWSDGSETNPKEFVVMQDTTFRAHFYMPEVEQEVVVDSIETHSVTITWDTVAGAVLYELRIYKNGQLVVTYEVDPDNNIIGEHHIGPDRIVARKDSTGGTSETLQVNIGGLEPGQDYTYSLDALDDDRSYVGAQSGTFTTEEDPENRLDVLFDDRRPQPRKVLQDGHLYIELPDGTRYNAEGQLIGN